MLSWEYPPRIVGGIARVVHDLSHAFAAQGHEVHVITYQEGETKEFEIAFKDEDHLFRQDKPFYIVLNPSISGVAASGAVEGDIWKGFLRYVEN